LRGLKTVHREKTGESSKTMSVLIWSNEKAPFDLDMKEKKIARGRFSSVSKKKNPGKREGEGGK